ncbi:trimeric intracellular cation channel family protein [Flavobacterium sp. '19STA2R22 D10 B1']|uniref:trimeric intracellular cation channel family protein n=1 Tax=Flavobacterium aerium TaxID=3037261 RepID=UPI00278BB142|nr:trimeric intracellular cation channel family protein [Flavobacterium sp. '19STA2R22 D10 B1']
MFYIIEILGTMAFAISGVLTGMSKKMDPFGVFIIGLFTAVGGGTLRDVLIGRTPVGWMRDLNSLYVIILGFFLALVFRKKLDSFRKSLLLFDTIGLGVFTIVGIEKGLEINLNPVICIALGTMTACFGGVSRDILCNEIPVIFRKEIYATICIVGGAIFFGLRAMGMTEDVLYVVTTGIIIAIRLMAVKYRWSLPAFEHHEDS